MRRGPARGTVLGGLNFFVEEVPLCRLSPQRAAVSSGGNAPPAACKPTRAPSSIDSIDELAVSSPDLIIVVNSSSC